MLMFKKPIFLFIIAFVLALASGSYFAVQEIRGKVIGLGGNLNMGDYEITVLGSPENSGDLVTKAYLKDVEKLYLPEAGVWHSIESWCDVQYFSGCIGADPYPEQKPEEEEEEEEEQ